MKTKHIVALIGSGVAVLGILVSVYLSKGKSTDILIKNSNGSGIIGNEKSVIIIYPNESQTPPKDISPPKEDNK